ncbi:MAG: HlyC/CorC family transporter [Ruminococcus sp.]|nr:HlyC/CorC family transporter [Ruminococcus sp.]MBR1864377.1 HlyC/CorC family transporter [Ruminococcus sp.]
MDDPGRWWQGAVICAAAGLISAFFYACEVAAAEFADKKLKTLSKTDPRAMELQKMLDGPGRFMRLNSISRIFTALVMSGVSMVYFFAPLRGALCRLFGVGQGEGGYAAVSALCILLLAAALSVVMGTVCMNIPRRLCLAVKDSDGFILRSVRAYRLWLGLFVPAELAGGAVSAAVLRLFGVKGRDPDDKVTEEEILMMVDAIDETGGLEEGQAEMISNIFEFDDIEISDVMTHRTEVVAIESGSPIKDAVRLAIDSGFSRIPVYNDTIDNIVGLIYAKDLLTMVFGKEDGESAVRDFMREIVYSPGSRKCGELFKEFTENKIQMAVVVDEYGGTAGVVTLEDLIETIVGSIQDEYDDEEEEILKVSEGVFEFEGNADYSGAMEALGKVPDEDSPFETIGAMVIDLLGRIPEEGERPSVRWENIRFSVIKAEDRKIERLRAEVVGSGTGEDKG